MTAVGPHRSHSGGDRTRAAGAWIGETIHVTVNRTENG
jgi:hypothetical protein